MDVYCFYHGDLDGITSAVEVLHHYPEAKCIAVDYGNTYTKYDLSNALVIVVDFSFWDMITLQHSCKELIWIDHHKTAYDMQRRAWKSPDIAGYRSLNFAGCMLTYTYFQKIPLDDIQLSIYNTSIPLAIQYINSYDLWQFEQGDDIDAFCATAYLEWMKPTNIQYDVFFDKTNNGVMDYIEKGKILIKAANRRITYLANRNKTQQIMTMQNNKVQLLFVNATCDISRLGSYINTELNCDIAAIYEIVGDNIRVHLRARTYNVEPIAKLLGGGGHPGAASYSTTDSVEAARDKLCAAIFRDLNLTVR